MTYMGKESEKEKMYMYVKVSVGPLCPTLLPHGL